MSSSAAVDTSATWAQKTAGKSSSAKASVLVWVEDWSYPQRHTFDQDWTLDKVVRIFQKPQRSIASVSTYGLNFTKTTKLRDIIQPHPRDTILLITHDKVTGIQARERAFAANNLTYTRVINEIVKTHWEDYSHITCGLVAYVGARGQENNSTNDHLTLREVEDFITRIKEGKEVMDRAEEQFSWDQSSGDCAGGHVRLQTRLTNDVRIRGLKWMIHEGGTHAMIFGTGVDGSGYLIDIGATRMVMTTPGNGVYELVSILGKANKSTEQLAVYRVEKEIGAPARIYMKQKGQTAHFIEMKPISSLRDLFDKVVLPIGVKKKYVLLIRSFWPLYHGFIEVDPEKKRLTVIYRDTRKGDGAFGRNGPRSDATYEAVHGTDKWNLAVSKMYEMLGAAEAWRKTRLQGQATDAQNFRSWRFLCMLLFREWDSG